MAALCREWSSCKEERRDDKCRRGVMTPQIGRYRRNPPGRLWLRLTQVLLGVLSRVLRRTRLRESSYLPFRQDGDNNPVQGKTSDRRARCFSAKGTQCDSPGQRPHRTTQVPIHREPENLAPSEGIRIAPVSVGVGRGRAKQKGNTEICRKRHEMNIARTTNHAMRN